MAKYYSISSKSSNFYSRLHYNGTNSFLFVNVAKIHQFKAKDSEIKKIPLSLGNSSRNFLIYQLKKKTGLNVCAYEFFCWL